MADQTSARPGGEGTPENEFELRCDHCGRTKSIDSHGAFIGEFCHHCGQGTWRVERPGACSRCKQPIPDFRPPDGGMTAGYYVASGWTKYANPGEVYICDRCMWTDPRYIADYGEQSAAVSAPASEPTPEDAAYMADKDWEEIADLTLNMLRDPMTLRDAQDARRFLTSYVVLRKKAARSPAPASGAPDEKVTELREWVRQATLAWGIAEQALGTDPTVVRKERESADALLDMLATRLAAAERAGVALREALGAWDAEAGVLAFTNVLIAARKCAALTPTAPSPDAAPKED